MNSFLQPDPVLLGFIFLKKFVYLELLAVLAALRVLLGGGLARWPAAATLVLALAGVATILAPMAGLNHGAVYASAARAMSGSGGLTALLVPSALFVISALLPGVRARWIDIVHSVMLTGLLGLWWWTS